MGRRDRSTAPGASVSEPATELEPQAPEAGAAEAGEDESTTGASASEPATEPQAPCPCKENIVTANSPEEFMAQLQACGCEQCRQVAEHRQQLIATS
jgi:hypothetical protein